MNKTTVVELQNGQKLFVEEEPNGHIAIGSWHLNSPEMYICVLQPDGVLVHPNSGDAVGCLTVLPKPKPEPPKKPDLLDCLKAAITLCDGTVMSEEDRVSLRDDLFEFVHSIEVKKDSQETAEDASEDEDAKSIYYSRSGFESTDLDDDDVYEIGKYVGDAWDRIAVVQTGTLAENIVNFLNGE